MTPRYRRNRHGYVPVTDERADVEHTVVLSNMRFGMGFRLPERRRRDAAPDIILRGRRPLYGFAALLVLLSVAVQQPLLFVAGLLVLTLAALPEIWYRYGLHGVLVSHQPTSNRVAFGGVVDVPVVIENRKPLPLPWIEVNDDFPDQIPTLGLTLIPSSLPERATLVNTLSLWAYQRVRRHYRVHATARGAYTFGPTHLRFSDPFGVLTRYGDVDAVSTLLVHPLIAPLDRFGLSPRAPFGERKASQRLLEDPLRMVGVRDYVPGDDPRRIHWQATARMGTLQSKLFEPSARHTLMIFLDTRTFINPNLGYDPLLTELGISAAASVASWGVGEGYAVGIVSNGTLAAPDLDDNAPPTPSPLGATRSDGAVTPVAPTPSVSPAPSMPADDLAREIARAAAHLRLRLPPSARPEQGTRILDGLARLLPYSGAPMSQLLSAEQRRLPTGATVVYIGAEAVVDVPTLIALRQLRAHGYAVSLLLMTADPHPDASVANAGNSNASAPHAANTAASAGVTPNADKRGSMPVAVERAEQASAHDLHLANLPSTYIGGRARWRALLIAALGADGQRRASQPISPQRRAAERALARAYAENPYLSPIMPAPTPETSDVVAGGGAPSTMPTRSVQEEAMV